MRSKFVICALLLFSITLYAQFDKIPQTTKETFVKLYPNAKDIKWEEEEETYEASFLDGTIKTSVVINEYGELLETEIEINVSDLAPSIKKFIAENYQDYKIAEVSKITDPKGNVKYDAGVTKDSKDMDLVFDENGKLLTKIFKESDDEDDEEED